MTLLQAITWKKSCMQKAFEVKTTDRSFEEQMLAYASKENEKEPETHEETGSEEDINFENFMFNYIKNA